MVEVVPPTGSSVNRTKKRIAYLSGPVDAAETYAAWKRGTQDSFFGTIYLNQFFQICNENDAEAYVVTVLPGKYALTRRDNFVFENRPPPANVGGIRYHLQVLAWYARFSMSLLRFRPDAIILTALANHWFSLFFLRWTRTSIILALHCSLWPKLAPLKRSWRALMWLNKKLLFKYVTGVIAVSDDAAEQFRTLVGDTDIEVLTFNATYPERQFAGMPPPDVASVSPFRVYYAGRVETNKGVYDLLEAARRLSKSDLGEFHFDVCGDGEELERLRLEAKRSHLENSFRCHGWCGSAQIAQLLGKSHCVVIPTTTDFEEGFPKVFAEAILSSRPVVTSAVCITKRAVAPAAFEVPANDVGGYVEALKKLRNDPALFEEKQAACLRIKDMFLVQTNSWGSRLRHVLSAKAFPR